ncbi:hypothetical protein M3649_19300 [Ureibacillus chungkukjangi]|uniref:hypothetical protein n=1 Tax=Ureibacillus chungkukjangi TaxID=1202712 RepID=UPI00203A61CF|nr:hypothetical protein [Ureibacillus chungkukjangi]MCM3390248.1 hypothetical protein [Ureibacillus chungkukjangi]
MGQYLQMGICNQIVIDKDNKLNIALEQVIESLQQDMDMSLFELIETEEQFVFNIKESIVMEHLHPFLQFQYSLYDQEEPYKKCFSSVLHAITECCSLQAIEEIANRNGSPCFQTSIIDDEIKISDWEWLRVEYTIWVMFAEGKIYMEAYEYFLRFLQNLTKASNKSEISGAFRCFIQ